VNCGHTSKFSGAARGTAIGQLPNNSKVIAQRFFKDNTNCPMPKNLNIHVFEDLNDVILTQQNLPMADTHRIF
jgi:hypothetical protein